MGKKSSHCCQFYNNNIPRLEIYLCKHICKSHTVWTYSSGLNFPHNILVDQISNTIYSWTKFPIQYILGQCATPWHTHGPPPGAISNKDHERPWSLKLTETFWTFLKLVCSMQYNVSHKYESCEDKFIGWHQHIHLPGRCQTKAERGRLAFRRRESVAYISNKSCWALSLEKDWDYTFQKKLWLLTVRLVW